MTELLSPAVWVDSVLTRISYKTQNRLSSGWEAELFMEAEQRRMTHCVQLWSLSELLGVMLVVFIFLNIVIHTQLVQVYTTSLLVREPTVSTPCHSPASLLKSRTLVMVSPVDRKKCDFWKVRQEPKQQSSWMCLTHKQAMWWQRPQTEWLKVRTVSVKHICLSEVIDVRVEGGCGGAYSIIQTKTGTPEDVLPRCLLQATSARSDKQ